MPLLRLDKVSLAFGHRALLDQVDLELRRGERICLVGRNGEGKSSLLRVIAGEVAPDDGELWVRPAMQVAHLAQEVTLERNDSVFDVVAGGLPGMGQLLTAYHTPDPHRSVIRCRHDLLAVRGKDGAADPCRPHDARRQYG